MYFVAVAAVVPIGNIEPNTDEASIEAAAVADSLTSTRSCPRYFLRFHYYWKLQRCLLLSSQRPKVRPHQIDA